jgi:ABC-type transport system substrate-binding protein
MNAQSAVDYITMNLAVAPFDDVHVRRALNLVLTGRHLRESRTGPSNPSH